VREGVKDRQALQASSEAGRWAVAGWAFEAGFLRFCGHFSDSRLVVFVFAENRSAKRAQDIPPLRRQPGSRAGRCTVGHGWASLQEKVSAERLGV
jgi:hypothetical protein